MFDCLLFIAFATFGICIVLDMSIPILNRARKEKECPKFVDLLIDSLCRLRDICGFVFVTIAIALCLPTLTYA